MDEQEVLHTAVKWFDPACTRRSVHLMVQNTGESLVDFRARCLGQGFTISGEEQPNRNNRRPKPVVALDVLMNGMRIEHQGHTWTLSEDNDLCTVAHRENGEEVLLRALGTDFQGFVEWAESIPYDDLFILGSQLVLMQMRGSNRSHVG